MMASPGTYIHFGEKVAAIKESIKELRQWVSDNDMVRFDIDFGSLQDNEYSPATWCSSHNC